MGTPLMGRYASVKLGTETGEDLIANLGSWSIDINMDDIDVTAFGSVWGKSMPGFQRWTATIEGYYDPADSTGQAVLQSNALSATKITDIRFYIDSTSYWTPDTSSDADAGCYINTVSIRHDKAGVAAVTYNVLGYGPLKLV